MEAKDSLYDMLRRFRTIQSNNQNLSVSRNEFLKIFKGTEKEALMEKMFCIFDLYDGKRDGASFSGTDIWMNSTSHNFFKFDSQKDDFVFDINFLKKKLGEDTSAEDFRLGLETLYNVLKTKKNTLEEQKNKDYLNKLKINNEDIPEFVLKKAVSLGVDSSIKVLNDGYELINKSGDKIYKLDLEGKLIQQISNNCYESEFGELNSLVILFDEIEKPKEIIDKYNGGYTFSRSPLDDKCIFKYGKTQIVYNGNFALAPRHITVNTGLPNETTFSIISDNNDKILDIVSKNSDSVLKIPDNVKRQLIVLLQKEAILGRHFDLKVNCNEVYIETIKDENLPQKAKLEIDRLGNNCIIEGVDYELKLQENGDCVIEYLNNVSQNFESDKKKTLFCANGEVIIYQINGDNVYVTENGKMKKYSKEVFSMIKPEYSLWANGPQQEKEWNYELFNIENSDFVNKLYEIGEKEYLSDSTYTQKIENHTYKISIEDNKILVNKDGKDFILDTSNLDKNLVKFVSKSNPESLYRMAIRATKLIFDIPPSGGDGEYLPEENVIYIAPEASQVSILQRRIVHEVGHTYYTHLSPVNKELEDSFKKESEAYEQEIKSIIDSVPKQENSFNIIEREKALKKSDKYAPDSDDVRYCATNIYEFVAEAYCLLITGNAKSEFTIAKVYPKTFEIFKKIFEENN